jgi:hypothetical protein
MSAVLVDWRSVVTRGLFSQFLVFSVYNPSGYSYVHWVLGGFDWFWLKLTVGAVLWVFLHMIWVTTWGVLRRRGIIAVSVFCIAGGLTLAQVIGTGSADFEGFVIWLLLSVSVLFTAALSYSHVHHRIGGITHTEEIAH